jgi:hypothetical protein
MMGLVWIPYSFRAISTDVRAFALWSRLSSLLYPTSGAISTDVIAFALVTAAGIGLAVSSVIAKRVGSSET